MRPGALQRAGLDAETLTERYPSLVCARGHGYGARGPDADRPGYDATAFWARGGMAHMLPPPSGEYPIGQRGALGDRNGALALAFGVAAALLKRTRTGTGSVVDVSLLATAMWTLSSDLLAALGGDEPEGVERAGAAGQPARRRLPDEGRSAHPARVPPAGPLLAGLLPAHRSPRPRRGPRFADLAARRENGAACVAELDAGVRQADLRRVEGAALPPRRALGPGAVGVPSFSTIRRWRRTGTSATW